LAYKLDRKLNLNIVPFTIMRDHPQLGKGSLQYFVRNTISPEEYRIKNNLDFGNLSAMPYPKELKSLWLLDYLIENMDRNSNWLVRSGGKIVAIDHAHSNGRLFGSNASLQPELYPQNKTLKLLKALDKKDFTGLEEKTQILFEKRSRLLKAIKEEKDRNKCGGIF
jgi:hypothetical protein